MPVPAEIPPVGAVIVTYNCGEKIIAVFHSLSPQVERTIFVDNGSADNTIDVLKKLKDIGPEKTEIMTLECNVGVSRALNIGVRRAISLGFKWVLTMDHDSIADGQMVKYLVDSVERHPKTEKVAVCAPIYVDAGDKMAGRYYRYDGWRRKRLFPLEPGQVLEPTVVITSGNLINADLYARLGGFDESLFIDYVDHDYCLRSLEAGLSVIVSTDARLSHSIGNATSIRLFGLSWFSTNHPASRRYTIGRNRMTMVRRYRRRFPSYAFWTAIGFGIDFVGILLCENDKWNKVKMMVRGARDSWKLKTGQAVS